MYLCDKDILKKLAELKLVTSNSEFPFLSEEQIQPCSVDLRIDNTFWIPLKRSTIDLRKTRLLEIEPRRYYKKVILKKGEHITLKPGKLLLGRVYEEFTIPNDCAGKISGRSSFARLGMMVHLTCDFMNPGYRGHMPLQLINFGNSPIKIFPYIPICQLQLIKVSDMPNRAYGVSELQSKYMNDDGGPSYWWRDKLIKKLQKTLGDVNLEYAIQEGILKIIGTQEPEVIERLDKKISKCLSGELENCDSILESFSASEDKRKLFRKILIYSSRGLFPVLFAASIGSFFSEQISISHYVLWTSSISSLPIAIYSFNTEVGTHLGKTELKELKNKANTI